MSLRRRAFVVMVAFLGMVAVGSHALPNAFGAKQGSYEDLLELFRQFRNFQRSEIQTTVPDYSATTMAEQYVE